MFFMSTAPPKNPANQLRTLRERAGLPMSEMARSLGLRGASSYQRYENPEMFKREFLPLEKARRLCRLIVGKGTPPITESEVLALAGQEGRMATPRMIPVVGYVGTNAEVFPMDAPAAGLNADEVQSPYDGLSHTARAVRVRGNALNPAYGDGDVVFYQEINADLMQLIGKDCLVSLADGRQFLRELRRTPDGLFYLHGHNLEPIFGVAIVRAAKVKLVWKAD
jgi:hypothetical protein